MANERLIGPAIIVVILVALLLMSFGTVPAGYRGVVLQFGAPTGEVKQPGFYAIIPFIQHVAKMNVQIKAYRTQAIESASADLQDVHTGVTVNYQVDPARVVQVFTNFGYEIEDRILQPNVQETIKASTAKFTAEQLITQRA